ncbi:hypothetical protein N7519_008971 [Penicillium mononematosum]|uniref:uncharacterized protein n=1 Tax=Penicillium mononematosum TaxID=268346 RepID=UPI002547FC9F|nr:uncharacterized protein N7519_008971 [Penicillium mononematosum]KAJ6178510.1 hypothetical protein N7519_008971 [Penicillium mononematosum]
MRNLDHVYRNIQSFLWASAKDRVATDYHHRRKQATFATPIRNQGTPLFTVHRRLSHRARQSRSHQRLLCPCTFLPGLRNGPMIEARLIAYDEGDNYVLYNVRTKKIARSRNVIFNKNPAPKDLPDPTYDLNIAGLNPQTEAAQQPLSDRHVPVDFLNEYN